MHTTINFIDNRKKSLWISFVAVRRRSGIATDAINKWNLAGPLATNSPKFRFFHFFFTFLEFFAKNFHKNDLKIILGSNESVEIN